MSGRTAEIAVEAFPRPIDEDTEGLAVDEYPEIFGSNPLYYKVGAEQQGAIIIEGPQRRVIRARLDKMVEFRRNQVPTDQAILVLKIQSMEAALEKVNQTMAQLMQAFHHQPGDASKFTREKLEELSRLPPNWDSYDGLPMNQFIIEAAQKFIDDAERTFHHIGRVLPSPFIAPVSTGAVQLEWDKETEGIDIEFCTDGTFLVLLRSKVDQPKAFSGDRTAAIGALVSFFGKASYE